MMYQTETSRTTEVARLEDYLRAFSQRKALVVTFLVFGFVLAYLYTQLAATTYTATTEVRLRPTPVGSVNENPKAPILAEEKLVLASDAVATEVAQTFPSTNVRQLDVVFEPDSNILVVSYSASSSQEAAEIANAFSSIYSAQRTAEAQQYYSDRIAANEQAIESNDASLQGLQEQRQDLANDRADLFDAAASESRAARLDEVNAALADLDSEISVVNRNTSQLRAAALADQTELATLSSAPPAEVLTAATFPTSPDGIPRSLLLVVGLILGLILGMVAAFFLERLDTTARDEGDVALALGTTVMGAIPTLGVGNRGGASSLIMLSAGGSARIAAAREAFRRLRSSLLFLNTSSGVSSIVVTSSAPAEGKSMTASNLAIALAQNNSRTVLVSADLRRPTLENLFGMEAPRPGLAEYLAQTAELNAEKVPGIENLWLIRAGRPPTNPGELLNSDRFEQMIKELERESVEYIVVDTPPVLSTADALAAARYVDGVLVVIDGERTNTSDLLQVRADLERSGATLLGAVINRRKFERAGLFKRDKYAYYKAESRRLAEG